MGSNKNLDYKIEPSSIVDIDENVSSDAMSETTSKIKDLLDETKKISFELKSEASTVSDKSKTRTEIDDRPFLRN